MVCALARAALDVSGETIVVQADVRQIDQLLDHPELKLLDRGRPIAVLVHDLLPWLSTRNATRTMTALHDWLPQGSAVSITHATVDMKPDVMRVLSARYADAGIAYHPRTRVEIQALLDTWAPLPDDLARCGRKAPDERRLGVPLSAVGRGCGTPADVAPFTRVFRNRRALV